MTQSNEIQTEPLGIIKVLKVTVGTAPVQVVLSPNVRTRSVVFNPDSSNAGDVGVGESGCALGTDAYPLYSATAFDVNLATGNVYLVAGGPARVVWVAALVDEQGQ